MIVITFIAYLRVRTLKKKVIVFVAVEALLDFAFSIIYCNFVYVIVHYNVVINDFVDFVFDAKNYYNVVFFEILHVFFFQLFEL